MAKEDKVKAQPDDVIKDRFYSTVPDEEVSTLAIRDRFFHLAVLINRHVPKGRAQSLALTKLEESCMWTVKGMTKDG